MVKSSGGIVMLLLTRRQSYQSDQKEANYQIEGTSTPAASVETDDLSLMGDFYVTTERGIGYCPECRTIEASMPKRPAAEWRPKTCGHNDCMLHHQGTCCVCGDTRRGGGSRYVDGVGLVHASRDWGYCPGCFNPNLSLRRSFITSSISRRTGLRVMNGLEPVPAPHRPAPPPVVSPIAKIHRILLSMGYSFEHSEKIIIDLMVKGQAVTVENVISAMEKEKEREKEIVLPSAPHMAEEDNNVCKICFEAEVGCVLVPCGHLGLCLPCGSVREGAICPFCRVDVKMVIRTFKITVDGLPSSHLSGQFTAHFLIHLLWAQVITGIPLNGDSDMVEEARVKTNQSPRTEGLPRSGDGCSPVLKIQILFEILLHHCTMPAVEVSIPAAYYRGGTSRALMFESQHLPPSRDDWGPILLSAMGSPDPNGRQLNGMGCGISSLSKVCVIGPPTRSDADVDYTFVGVGIERGEIDFSTNCGNMSSAVGPFAYDRGYLSAITDGPITLRIHNTNTNKILHSRFFVRGGRAELLNGPEMTSIDGVPDFATKILLDFVNPGGARTGRLLPTGNVEDVLCGVRVSMVDAANPCVFVRGKDLGLPHLQRPEVLRRSAELIETLENVRRHAGVAMGLSKSLAEVPYMAPKIAIVYPPLVAHDHITTDTSSSTSGLSINSMSTTEQPHLAVQVTVAVCAAIAAKLKGSVVHQVCEETQENIIIGHPAGRLVVEVELEDTIVKRAGTVRTARKLMEGRVFYIKNE
ncbi:hypothetical protein PROFUN_06713 [Planoprotostelium fungivorum]|uniref:RING-type domain-containing protein n=1 Tax=Planoprotostelium fungivorum TaxID=1890364 RepID=A0A2P6NG48_9EUKA|nr:hypothetical protein PROFUN_06713 [Planoprotostelium fungivorum]